MKLYVYYTTLSNLNFFKQFFSFNFLVCINSLRILKEPRNIKGNSSSEEANQTVVLIIPLSVLFTLPFVLQRLKV